MTHYKLIRLSSVALAMFAGSALAADLPKTKAPPEPPPPVFSWQGGYAGIYGGALLGDGGFTLINQTPIRSAAFVGGGTLGYNWQWTERVVLGAEADFGYRGSITVQNTGYTYPSTTVAGVLGTFRARAGYTISPRWLVYATAGLAYGTNFVSQNFRTLFPWTYGSLDSGPTVRPGWTAGAGVEYAWSDKISLKGEYLYTWLATSGVTYTTNRGAWTANVNSAGHVVRAGLNYHFAAGPLVSTPVLPQ